MDKRSKVSYTGCERQRPLAQSASNLVAEQMEAALIHDALTELPMKGERHVAVRVAERQMLEGGTKTRARFPALSARVVCLEAELTDEHAHLRRDKHPEFLF